MVLIMSNIFSYEFEELPLVIHNGIEAAEINGCAEIRYNRDAEWHIESIAVEGRQPLTLEQRAAGKKPWIYVKAPAELEHLVGERLEGEWYDKVCDAVREQLEFDREAALEERADMRRDERMGL
jgi:hypothetical protein